MSEYKPLELSDITIIDTKLDFCLNNQSDIKLFKTLKSIDNNLNIIQKNKTKNSRIRQLKINEASKRTRQKKKLHMKYMSDHIKKLHELINKYNITNIEIIDEVYNFDKTILI